MKTTIITLAFAVLAINQSKAATQYGFSEIDIENTVNAGIIDTVLADEEVVNPAVLFNSGYTKSQEEKIVDDNKLIESNVGQEEVRALFVLNTQDISANEDFQITEGTIPEYQPLNFSYIDTSKQLQLSSSKVKL